MGLGCGWGWWGLIGWCLGVRGLGCFGGLGLVVWLWVGFSDNKICRLLRFFFICRIFADYQYHSIIQI